MHSSSIIAQSTPSGYGALALIRLSGADAVAIAQNMAYFPNPKNLADQKSHTIHYGWIIDENGDRIDQVLFLLMRVPHTFTGDDTVEITCHNNPFIIQRIIAQAIRYGARMAQPGEFTRRAFENKKIDLMQAEAINELLCAQTETALKKSLAQLDGSLSHWIAVIEERLIKAYAWSEASFEFLEDEGDFGQTIKHQLEEVNQMIAQALKTFDVQKQIREGFRIALIGSVNAGKSSLFNRLLAQERSIVTDIAGTTRDTVEAGLYRQGNHWTLIDTAGLRQTEDVIEQKGIKRSYDEAQKADILILVIDGSRTMIAQEQKIYEHLHQQYAHKIMVVINKADQQQKVQNIFPEALHISTISGFNIDRFEQAIETKIQALLQKSDAPFLLNKRQHALLQTLQQQIQAVIKMLTGDIQYELVSYHLREALENISSMTGKTISEAAMDTVFKEFCVGK
jgi:tRNA modification GTPase